MEARYGIGGYNTGQDQLRGTHYHDNTLDPTKAVACSVQPIMALCSITAAALLLLPESTSCAAPHHPPFTAFLPDPIHLSLGPVLAVNMPLSPQ